VAVDHAVDHTQQVLLRAIVGVQRAQVALDQVHDRRAGELGLLDVVDRVAADARSLEQLRDADHDHAHDEQGHEHLDQAEARAQRTAQRPHESSSSSSSGGWS
jgi:hypothetical protein